MNLHILLPLLTIPVSAATLYNEASQADLPQNATAPLFNPTLGNNVVYGKPP